MSIAIASRTMVASSSMTPPSAGRVAVVEDKVDTLTERLDGLIERVDGIDRRLVEFWSETLAEFGAVGAEMREQIHGPTS